jgi:hypothetical protein
MKPTKTLAFSILLLAALFAAACEWEPLPADTDVFYTKLRGTWESNDPSIYSGTLIIDNKSITISGYSESQTPFPGGDVDKRPFKGFTRGVPLKGHSEEENTTQANRVEGFIFIEDRGLSQSPIQYTYWEIPYQSGNKSRQFLSFTFGEREEILEKTAQ